MTLPDLSPDVLALNPELTTSAHPKRRAVFRLGKIDSEPVFRSDFEKRVWREWIPTQQPILALYEPFVLHLKGGIRYTPDFSLLTKSGELWLVEAKEHWDAYISGRSSKRSLKQAAEEFAWLARFFALTPTMERRPNKKGKMVWKAVGYGFELHEYGGDDAQL